VLAQADLAQQMARPRASRARLGKARAWAEPAWYGGLGEPVAAFLAILRRI